MGSPASKLFINITYKYCNLTTYFFTNTYQINIEYKKKVKLQFIFVVLKQEKSKVTIYFRVLK